ncbi:hypothetical protein HPB52_010439 [Rhipicephalus sanguineus]|uniref:Uncharacterized protein n=1 Tax=Rhipicephalus sanguineus TaxID=34632 RepID=A0A9D4T7Q2_RHISA|nr:hypothetical protein HPB52_010439 [Rhipicephalus sanguineus]
MHPVHDLQRRKRRAIAILKQHGRREGVLFVDAARYSRHSGDGNGEQPQPPPLQQNVRDELGCHHHHRYYCYDNNGNSASANIKDKASQQRRSHKSNSRNANGQRPTGTLPNHNERAHLVARQLTRRDAVTKGAGAAIVLRDSGGGTAVEATGSGAAAIDTTTTSIVAATEVVAQGARDQIYADC